jgi:alpha-D-xyloside xylohydrolase
MPLYVRAGSIVPMGPRMEYATEKMADTIELRIYPGADGQFSLYEDENETYNYEKGQFATINFSWKDKEKLLTIGDSKGSFPGQLKRRVFRVLVVGEGKGIGEDPTAAVDKTVPYMGKAVTVKVVPPAIAPVKKAPVKPK